MVIKNDNKMLRNVFPAARVYTPEAVYASQLNPRTGGSVFIPLSTGTDAFNIGIDVAANQSVQTYTTTTLEQPLLDSIVRVEPSPVQELDVDDLMKSVAVEAEEILGYASLARKYGIRSKLQQTLDKLQISTLEPHSVFEYKEKMRWYMRTKMYDPQWGVTSIECYREPIPVHVLDKAISIKKEMPEVRFMIEELHTDPFLIAYDSQHKSFSQPGLMDFTSSAGYAAYIDVWAEREFEQKL